MGWRGRARVSGGGGSTRIEARARGDGGDGARAGGGSGADGVDGRMVEITAEAGGRRGGERRGDSGWMNRGGDGSYGGGGVGWIWRRWSWRRRRMVGCRCGWWLGEVANGVGGVRVKAGVLDRRIEVLADGGGGPDGGLRLVDELKAGGGAMATAHGGADREWSWEAAGRSAGGGDSYDGGVGWWIWRWWSRKRSRAIAADGGSGSRREGGGHGRLIEAGGGAEGGVG